MEDLMAARATEDPERFHYLVSEEEVKELENWDVKEKERPGQESLSTGRRKRCISMSMKKK
jgi:hypothetical protein